MEKNKQINIPVITGPTGCGKTFLALKLAEKIKVEIISVDSRQVYKHMDIGTAKPTLDELNKIPHHLISIKNPDEEFNAGQFVKLVNQIVPQIIERGALPLFVGGTFMYIWALEEGLFDAGETPEHIKEKIENLFQENGLNALYTKLTKVDAKAAEKIHPNDKQRIFRALEVYENTGKPVSYWKSKTKKSFHYPLKKIIIFPNREELYEKINSRVDKMIANGLVSEVEKLLAKGYSLKNNALRSVGYQEVIQHLNNYLSYEEMISEIKKNSRHYAKRQYTWLRKMSGIFIKELNENIVSDLEKKLQAYRN